MQSTIDSLLSALAGMLGPLSPFAKAIVPGALAVADVLVNLVFTGSLDSTDLAGAAAALIAAIVAYLVPNKAKPVAPAAPVVPAVKK